MVLSKSSPRVLQVNKLYYPNIGGIEKVVQDLSEGLISEYKLDVLASQPKGWRTKNEVINRVNITRTSSFGVVWSMPISPAFMFEMIRNVGKYDIVHFHYPFPLADLSFLLTNLLKLGSRPKIVVTWHSDIIRQKKVMKYYRPFLEKFLDLADVILPTSPNLVEKSEILQKYKEKCRVVPLGINLNSLKKVDESIILKNKLKYSKTILFVGRLCYYKGIEYLIEAMPKISANLIICGDGELKEELVNQTKERKIVDKVHFIGKCSQIELNTWFKSSDIFVLPSVEPSEAFGLVQAEAMSFGKPVINTNLPTGVPYVSLHEQTGITVPPADTNSLVEAINLLLEEKEKAIQYGKNGRERVEKYFTVDKMVNNVKEIYKEILA